MRNYEFYQLDVFTDKAFCGNPLAIFPEAKGLPDQGMQNIARCRQSLPDKSDAVERSLSRARHNRLLHFHV